MAKPQTDPFDRPFAWSYSRLKNFETCANKHLHIEILKDVPMEESEQLTWGNEVHNALASAIGTDDNKQRHPRDTIEENPLPPTMAQFQPWVDRLRKPRESGAKVYAELSYAITADFKPTTWFSPTAWFRTKVDVLLVAPTFQHAAAWDWKTGKRLVDSPQLMLTAIAVMVHNPSIKAVRTEFVWLKEMKAGAEFDCVDRVAFTRDQMPGLWNGIAPRVDKMKTAFATRNYPPNPSGLCRRHCPVNSCQFHGR